MTTWSEVDRWIKKHGGRGKIFPRQPDFEDLIEKMRDCVGDLWDAIEDHSKPDALKALGALTDLINKAGEHDCSRMRSRSGLSKYD